MWTHCNILSNNIILQYKLKEFINKTPFLQISEDELSTEMGHIIFWDIDSVNKNQQLLEDCLGNGGLVLVISSVLSKDMMSLNFKENQIISVGTLTKNMNYQEFLEALSNLAG